MKTIYDRIAEREKSIVKEAILGAALRLGLRGAGAVMRNPIKSVGAALTATDLAAGPQKFSNVATANRANPFRPPVV